MSQYLQMFFRYGDEFIELDSFCRCDKLYQAFEYIVPYEGITNITESKLNNALENVKESIAEVEKDIANANSRREAVIQFNNPLEEKLDFIADCDEFIGEETETLTQLKDVCVIIGFLKGILSNRQYNCDSKERGGASKSPDEFLYMGIEIGKPTINDIK